MASENSPQITTPTPDPTKATVEAIEIALLAQRDYVNGKFEALAERLRGIDKANEVLAETVNRTPTDIQVAVEGLGSSFGMEIKRLYEQVGSLDRLTDAKFITQKTMLDAQANQVAIALEASEKAIIKAEVATDKRFEAVNEFRKSLSDLSSMMATRRELEQVINEVKHNISQLNEQTSELRSRLDVGPQGLSTLQNKYSTSEGVRQGNTEARAVAIAAIGILIGIVGLASRFFN